jgi:hypothetical protein
MKKQAQVAIHLSAHVSVSSEGKQEAQFVRVAGPPPDRLSYLSLYVRHPETPYGYTIHIHLYYTDPNITLELNSIERITLLAEAVTFAQKEFNADPTTLKMLTGGKPLE